MNYRDHTLQEIDQVMQKAWEAFLVYRKISLLERADFMRMIASEIEGLGDELIEVAAAETHLKEARLRSERARTLMQLRSYGAAAEKGDWLEARIDHADNERNPPKPEIRKMLIPLGPVVVFGASNFPFAYSTAGGDTACAFAAGCPVIVKAHPAHVQTSTLVAGAIGRAVQKSGLPEAVFTHVYGQSTEVGKALVMNRYTKAVGFTGSFQGGKALFDWANGREEPIPVFAEMGSINPVFLLPEKLKSSAASVAEMYAASITLGAGQFCTNPGIIFGIEGEDLDVFVNELAQRIRRSSPEKMLHTGIAKNYASKKKELFENGAAEEIAVAEEKAEDELVGSATIASASAKAFLQNPLLHHEVFGPYSLIIRCRDLEEMNAAARASAGQLTATLMATEKDILQNQELVESVKNICGRLIMNSVPTGVEVCLSMHHGGPYPATTDSRFTSVGADGIKRFARPLSFQNWPDSLLPPELKESNPLAIWRTVNGELSK